MARYLPFQRWTAEGHRTGAARAGEEAAEEKNHEKETGERENVPARHRAALRAIAVRPQAVSSAALAVIHSSSAFASAATTLARVFERSTARAGSRANSSP